MAEMIPDPVSERKLQLVFPDIKLRWDAVKYALHNTTGLQIRVTRGLSSYQNQLELYRSGRTRGPSGKWYVSNSRKVVTNALPGHSFHNFGLAIDSCFMGDDPYLEKLPLKEAEDIWNELGVMVRGAGMEWGGDWKGDIVDRPHCQLPVISLDKARDIFQTQGIIAVYNYCTGLVENCGREAK